MFILGLVTSLFRLALDFVLVPDIFPEKMGKHKFHCNVSYNTDMKDNTLSFQINVSSAFNLVEQCSNSGVAHTFTGHEQQENTRRKIGLLFCSQGQMKALSPRVRGQLSSLEKVRLRHHSAIFNSTPRCQAPVS